MADSETEVRISGGGSPAEAASPRSRTRPVQVGAVTVGGGAPVSVQSMCTTDTADAAATLEQIARLAEAGCEIVRVALPSSRALDGFREICAASPLPVVADVHFDHRLAIEACRRGAAALRVNPGNIGGWDRVDAVIDEAGAAGVPIRIGVNAGSLDPAFAEREDLSQVEKLVGSATSFVGHFRERGFSDVVLSAKAHDVTTTVEVNRALSRALPEVPLHLGVTEAGGLRQGTVKNAAAVGALLMEGIGDTIRLSLTADPVEEVHVAWDLLSAVGLRRLRPEMVSCPTCGRCQWDLMGVAAEVERRLADVRAPISVAVMGCMVNGPGEARGADLGLAGGRGQALLFAHGEPLRTVSEADAVDELFSEIERRFS